jgi:hypothetical protein
MSPETAGPVGDEGREVDAVRPESHAAIITPASAIVRARMVVDVLMTVFSRAASVSHDVMMSRAEASRASRAPPT